MSSILKALKKVEGEQAAPRDTEGWSHEFSTRKAIRKQANRSRWLRVAGGVAVIAVILGTGGWVIYGQRHEIRHLASSWTKAPPAAPEEEERPASSPPGTSSPIEPVPSRAPQDVEASPPLSPRPAEPVRAVSDARPQSVRPASVAGGRPGDESDLQAPASLNQKEKREGEERPPLAEASEDGSSATMDTRAYRLEAIVWSSNPSSRFAVINGRILREGGGMEGMTVTAIEPNRVTIRSGRETGTLQFTIE